MSLPKIKLSLLLILPIHQSERILMKAKAR